MAKEINLRVGDYVYIVDEGKYYRILTKEQLPEHVVSLSVDAGSSQENVDLKFKPKENELIRITSIGIKGDITALFRVGTKNKLSRPIIPGRLDQYNSPWYKPRKMDHLFVIRGRELAVDVRNMHSDKSVNAEIVIEAEAYLMEEVPESRVSTIKYYTPIVIVGGE